jgi:hypothetical protein
VTVDGLTRLQNCAGRTWNVSPAGALSNAHMTFPMNRWAPARASSLVSGLAWAAGATANSRSRAMADDLTDAEDEARQHDGFERHPYGRMIARLMRTARLIVTRLKALEDRVKALEGR